MNKVIKNLIKLRYPARSIIRSLKNTEEKLEIDIEEAEKILEVYKKLEEEEKKQRKQRKEKSREKSSFERNRKSNLENEKGYFYIFDKRKRGNEGDEKVMWQKDGTGYKVIYNENS